MENLFFESWEGLLRILIVSSVGYIVLIVFLRLFGKRTLSKMNAFDFIVTVAIGSVLAAIAMSQTMPLLEGILALGMLIGLQFIISWLASRSERFEKLLKSTPTLVFYKGEFLEDAMKSERIAKDELLQIMREQGSGVVEDVEAVILETDGGFSVIEKLAEDSIASACLDVEGVEVEGKRKE